MRSADPLSSPTPSGDGFCPVESGCMITQNLQSAAAALAVVFLFACGQPSQASPIPSRAAAVEALAHRYFLFTWAASPTSTTDNGLHTGDDRLADFSAAADRAYGAKLRAMRDELAA